MAEASATAEGELGRTPLAHLLVYALDRRLTGALFLTQADGTEHVVRLARGVPVKVRPGDRFALLGEMLVEAGAIDEATLKAALETKGLLGDMLLLAGRVERDTLEKIAETQFVRRMVRLFDLPPDTAYRYYDGHEELRDYGGDPANVDPIMLIWSGLRAHAERSALMEGTLAKLGDKPMRLHPAATLSRFGLEQQEADLHEFLAIEPVTVDELVALELAPPDLTRRFAYALLITRQIEMGAASTPLGAVDSTRSPAAGATPAQTAFARMQLRSTVHRVGAAAPDLPGDGERGPGPSAAVSRAAARRAAKAEAAARADEAPTTARSSTTPDAPAEPVSEVKPTEPAPESGVRSPRPPSAAVASAPASQTLRSEPEPKTKEPEPKEPVTTGGDPPAQPEPPPAEPDPFAGKTAADLVALARERLAERDPKAAVSACEAARKHAPDDGDVIALGAWARFQAGSADVKALTIELDELLAVNAGHVAARYYRAMLRKRLSDEAGCVRDLRQVLELSPDHADAARELETLEPKPSKQRSFMDRFFKR